MNGQTPKCPRKEVKDVDIIEKGVWYLIRGGGGGGLMVKNNEILGDSKHHKTIRHFTITVFVLDVYLNYSPFYHYSICFRCVSELLQCSAAVIITPSLMDHPHRNVQNVDTQILGLKIMTKFFNFDLANSLNQK